MAEPTQDYLLCGWRVASAVNLPELPRAAGAPGGADITIAFGEVPERLDDPVLTTPSLQLDASGTVLYRIRGVAAYLVERGSSITISPELPREAPDLRLFLLGSVFGFLCHQRGVLPVHAAAVEIDGRAVAFAGSSGAGKSTLAAAFRRRGFRLLADDVTPIAMDEMRFLPGLRRIRLWSDSARAAEWPTERLERCRAGLEKFSQAFDDGFVTAPLAPQALFHLSQAQSDEGSFMVNRLHGTTALKQLSRHVYRRRALAVAVGKEEAMSRVVRAAAGIPRHFELRRQFGYSQLDSTIDAIVDTVRSSR
jgi:hypothetical protein